VTITSDQIPEKAAEMLRALGINEYTAKVYIAAVLNAWPQARHDQMEGHVREFLILPLAKEI